MRRLAHLAPPPQALAHRRVRRTDAREVGHVALQPVAHLAQRFERAVHVGRAERVEGCRVQALGGAVEQAVHLDRGDGAVQGGDFGGDGRGRGSGVA
jgi:hypothetical protein